MNKKDLLPKFLRNPEKTAKDLPLVFEVEHIEVIRGAYEFWGKITHDKKISYSGLKFIFTVFDSAGNFMKREETWVTPDSIANGCVVFVNSSFDCKAEQATTVLYNITGEKDETV